MTREFESLTRRFDEGHLKSKETAAECRMANMLVEDVLSHGAYELPELKRRHIVAYSDIATPHTTMDDGAAWGATRTMVHATGNRTRRQRSLPHARHATISHIAGTITRPPTL
jgi:hypothetical protein